MEATPLPLIPAQAGAVGTYPFRRAAFGSFSGQLTM